MAESMLMELMINYIKEHGIKALMELVMRAIEQSGRNN